MIPLFNDFLGGYAIHPREPHDLRNSVRQGGDDLYMKRGGNLGEQELSTAAQNHHVVRCGEFGDRGPHHLVIDPAVFLDSRQPLCPNRKLLIDHDVHRLAVNELKVQRLRSRCRNLAAAASCQA